MTEWEFEFYSQFRHKGDTFSASECAFWTKKCSMLLLRNVCVLVYTVLHLGDDFGHIYDYVLLKSVSSPISKDTVGVRRRDYKKNEIK